MNTYQDQKAIQLTSELREYLLQVGVREADCLKRLREQSALMPERDMQILPEQGQFISMLIKILCPKHILEIGTYTGYSALCMALASPKVKVTALDKNVEWTKIAKKYWEEAGVSNRIQLILGPALESLKTFSDESFDFVFIDGDKRNYLNYYEESLRVVSNEGIIVIDNVLWRGRVIDPSYVDLAIEIIRKLNDTIKNDTRVEICMLPIGDGLTIVRKLDSREKS